MNLIACTPWGGIESRPVYLFRLTNSSGAFVELTNFGAALVSAHVPDRYGRLGNVVLGYENLQGYLTDPNYMGVTIGRFANRIGCAAFELDGRRYLLEANDGANTNHGGPQGFHRQVFNHEIGENYIAFHYTSPDGEGGFPGTLELRVRYEWTEDNALIIGYQATTDLPTIANFTNHAYFNLSAEKSVIDGHKLQIFAQNIVEAGADHVPTGLIKPAGAFAFGGNDIGQKIRQENGKKTGINICYILDKQADNLSEACKLSDPKSGRSLIMRTTYPAIIAYTGEYIAGQIHQPFEGLCLECQYFPDSPNHPVFPSATLRPGELYDHLIELYFS
ncbi:aldose 1-epimerase [Dyadobacter sp. SG02]|uniref:aldose epimerase family protein n=1 Tax=Dyadobacter sp. SG02 TaxID=1855291 RepID=UPI0008D67BD2|nr:aldose epimerase family protein [Dyadobacter sp. SG02]SEJ75577.1 aldose 1-epimerase [Dyadobacter sp. SG02]